MKITSWWMCSAAPSGVLMNLGLLQKLKAAAETKVVLLVLDGLGGLPDADSGLTELEQATTPNLDDLAADSVCGLHQPCGPGITPGSGPGHLALFGYDSQTYEIGRGVLSALGSDFELTERDVAARGNFCTIDEQGNVTDRRAGRISTDKNRELCEQLSQIKLEGVELFVQPVKEHRFLLVLRGTDLSGDVTDTDPQTTGRPPLDPTARSDAARRTAALVSEFVRQARERLAEHHPANMVLMRGFASLPDWPSFGDVFGVRPAAVADYPMYRGVARLVGMQVLDCPGDLPGKLNVVKKQWKNLDFFFVHIKPTDSRGEDGDFKQKQEQIELTDEAVPELRKLGADVLIVTGDHSTPAGLEAHSWHPVPVLLWSKYCRRDEVRAFGERACIAGGLGPRLPTADLMPIAMANALRIGKFGA